MTHIIDKDRADHIDTGYGEHIYKLAASDVGNMQKHSVVLVEVDPGKSSKKHYHPEIEETYYIISGHAKVIVNEEEIELNPGELIAIEPNTNHKLINASDNDKLVLIATCATPWTKDCSVFLE